jgi:hypothetical protein
VTSQAADACQKVGLKFKIYNTMRELSNHAREVWAFRALNETFVTCGFGGGRFEGVFEGILAGRGAAAPGLDTSGFAPNTWPGILLQKVCRGGGVGVGFAVILRTRRTANQFDLEDPL